MNLFGLKIDLKRLASSVAKVALPVVIGALVTKTSVKKAITNAARDEVSKLGRP